MTDTFNVLAMVYFLNFYVTYVATVYFIVFVLLWANTTNGRAFLARRFRP